MATKTNNDRLRFPIRTAAEWTQLNPRLMQGEFGIESDTGYVKYGDGIHLWADLEYVKTPYAGTADTATKLATARTIGLTDADGTNTGTAISFDGTADGTLKLPVTIKASLTGNADTATTATKANYPNGFASRKTSATWGTGNGIGTFLTDWSSSNGGEIVFRENGGQLNVVIDGQYYANEGNSLVLHTGNYNDYAPKKDGTGASGDWGINVTGSSASCTGNAATATKLNSRGIQTAITGKEEAGLYTHQVYNNGYPINYGNLLTIGGKGGGQLLLGWSGTTNAIEHLYYRNRRDNATTWSEWQKVAFTTDTVSGATNATQLATARTIDGVDFDGTAAINHYGTCSTEAATAAKVVALTGFKLVTGAEVNVRFTVTNTAANPTLNVNGTGAKAIYYRNAAITAGYLAANRTYMFVYDGTYYQLVGDINTNTTYSNFTKATADAAGKAGLVPAPAAGKQAQFLRGDATWAYPGQLATARTIDGVDFNGTAAISHYGTCGTAAATAAKVVGCTNFKLVTGSRIIVKFTVTNTAANPTLNVNSTGAKAIYYRGAAITAGTLANKRIYEFVYDGSHYELIGTA